MFTNTWRHSHTCAVHWLAEEPQPPAFTCKTCAMSEPKRWITGLNTVCPRYNAPRYNAESGITRSTVAPENQPARGLFFRINSKQPIFGLTQELAQSCVSTAQYAHIAVYYKQTDYKQEHNKHYQYTVGAVLLACCSICRVWILHLLSAPSWIDVTHSIGSFTNAVPVRITLN